MVPKCGTSTLLMMQMMRLKKGLQSSGITSGDGGEGGMGESHVSNFSDAVLEGNKSGDNSLRDWFSKSRSSDGKVPGWVQLGGKYAGKPVQSNPDKPQNQVRFKQNEA